MSHVSLTIQNRITDRLPPAMIEQEPPFNHLNPLEQHLLFGSCAAISFTIVDEIERRTIGVPNLTCFEGELLMTG
jgi:hypothetical protein